MERKGAEGLSAGPWVTPAANEEFPGTVKELADMLDYPRSGWDPYEVWRTRVKASSRMNQEPERDTLR